MQEQNKRQLDPELQLESVQKVTETLIQYFTNRPSRSENLQAIERLHAKIRRNTLLLYGGDATDRDNVTSQIRHAKKIRKNYAVAIERIGQENDLITDLQQKIDAAILELSQIDQRKKTKTVQPLMVAARTNRKGDVWIQAQVVSQQNNQFEVEDLEQDPKSPDYRKRHILSAQDVIVLGVQQQLYVGASVLALFPDTSCFYKAKVVEGLKQGYYIVTFEDDDNRKRKVDQGYVLPYIKS